MSHLPCRVHPHADAHEDHAILSGGRATKGTKALVSSSRRLSTRDPTGGQRSAGLRWAGHDTVAWLEYVSLALVAYVPQLLSHPGVVDTDTKTYLYLEPASLIQQSASMWQSTIGMGTVAWQAIGYLWPMGPFFWVAHVLGIPLWVAERLWVGTLLFGAGAGVLFLCRTLNLRGPGRFVAAFAYMLSPYFLQYVGRISELLLPWAGLGWLTALAILAVRNGGWRYPALFALVWLTISGANATAVIFVALAPVLWMIYAWLTKEHSLGQVWAGLWRAALLSGLTSLWWLESLLIEGRYGLNILTYTEQPSHIAYSSLSSEVLRGLGYWYYYGYDAGGPWAATSVGYSQHLWLIATSFAVPVLALAMAVLIRWRMRAYLIVLVVVGMVLAVGAYPYTTPSLVGAVLKFLMTHTQIGLALRSTDRATPLVTMGLALLLGGGVSALARRRPRAGTGLTILSLGLVAAANPPVWDGATVPLRYTMPVPLPSSVRQTAAALNSEHTDTRVLAIPGQNTAAYTWGYTEDPVWPGILTRPFVTREQLPLGSLPSYDLLYALDNPMQTDTLNPNTIAPLARLMSVGDILVQNDLNYALFDQPQPQQLWAQLHPSPTGLGPATGYGKPVPNLPSVPEVNLTTPPSSVWPSPLEVLPVEDPRPLARAEATSGAVVIDGDGVGLDAAAGLGLLDTTAPILYAGTLDGHAKLLDSALQGDATLVVTDSNRKQNWLWSRIQGNAQATLSASAPAPATPLDIFSTSSPRTQTTASVVGVSSVTAQPAGAQNPPVNAIAGLPGAAWATSANKLADGDFWQVELTRPVTTGHITIAQATFPNYEIDQRITKVTVTFDGGSPVTVPLGPSSSTSSGQVVSFSPRRFRTLTITIDDTNLDHASGSELLSASPVGLADVEVAGVRAREVTVMPSDLLSSAGRASASHRLVVVMTRDRVSDDTPQTDPEPVLTRSFQLPTSRTFTLSGTARVDSSIGDSTVDTLVGRTGNGGDVAAAYSSSRLSGDLNDTASAALDGNLTTMWSPSFGLPSQQGSWLQVNLAGPVDIDQLDMAVVADHRHSVPTAVQIRACDAVAPGGTCPAGSRQETVDLPPIHDSSTPNATTTVDLRFPALTGRDLTFTFTGVRIENIRPSGLALPLALPLGIAELGIPGVRMTPAATNLAGSCQSDLLSIDGKPVSVRVTGSTKTALAGGALSVEPCGADAGGITLGPGTHVVETAYGGLSGLDIDQLVLDSAAGGTPAPAPGPDDTVSAPAPPGPAPEVRVVSEQTTSWRLEVTGTTQPFWLVLGESVNDGWHVTVNGKSVSGDPVLVDGYANGWLVDPSRDGPAALDVSVRWTPQSGENLSLVASAAAVVACLALVLWPRRRRRLALESDQPLLSVTGPAPSARPTTPLRPPEAMAVAAVIGLLGATLMPGLSLAAGGFVIVFLSVLFALLLAKLRMLIRFLVVGFASAAVVYTLIEQALNHWESAGWLSHFERADDLVWMAIILLGADLAVGLVRRMTR